MAPDHNGSNGATRPDRYLDLDAFVPAARPGARVKVNGIEYPVRQLIHLTGQEELDLATLERALDEATSDMAVRRAMFDRAFTLVRVLVPSLPTSVRMGLTYEAALAISAAAWAYATEPSPLAGTATPAPAPEASSRPESAAPTAATPAT